MDGNREQVFHVVSRVVGRARLLGAGEKTFFVKLMRRLEAFSGVEVMAFTVMGNHFHLLLRVPAKPDEIGEAEIWRRMRYIYPEHRMKEMRAQVEEFRSSGRELMVREFFDRQRRRMFDLSEYVRELKVRFSKWYNQEHDRKGTLWEERFRCSLVEGSRRAMMTVGGYIELNAVRAGLVGDPKDYRWCSYGEAAAGGRKAREGIRRIATDSAQSCDGRDKSMVEYREFFLGRMCADGGACSAGVFSQDSGQPVKAPAGAGSGLSLAQGLMCRVRYFTDGLAIGSREFVAGVAAHLARFALSPGGDLRRPRPMRYANWGGLHSYRDLRKDPVVREVSG